jgi:hypothetical protein
MWRLTFRTLPTHAHTPGIGDAHEALMGTRASAGSTTRHAHTSP